MFNITILSIPNFMNAERKRLIKKIKQIQLKTPPPRLKHWQDMKEIDKRISLIAVENNWNTYLLYTYKKISIKYTKKKHTFNLFAFNL